MLAMTEGGGFSLTNFINRPACHLVEGFQRYHTHTKTPVEVDLDEVEDTGDVVNDSFLDRLICEI